MKAHQLKTYKDTVSKVEQLSKVLLASTKKKELLSAFEDAKCIITGRCICDMCASWEKDTYVVYEFGRCLFPSRFFQLLKERHFKTRRWEYVGPAYKDLYDTISVRGQE